MKLSEIEKLDKDMLVPEDIADILGCHPYSINVQAKKDQSKLGFPVSVVGTRVKIPRLAFINFMKGGKAEDRKGTVC